MGAFQTVGYARVTTIIGYYCGVILGHSGGRIGKEVDMGIHLRVVVVVQHLSEAVPENDVVVVSKCFFCALPRHFSFYGYAVSTTVLSPFSISIAR